MAEELGLISHAEVVERLGKTITTLERMERHRDSGQYFNWYDHRTGEKLTTWPATGDPLLPVAVFSRQRLAGGRPAQRPPAASRSCARANAIYESMDFGFYYRPDRNQILFHYAPSNGQAPCCYDTTVSESRIASYIGIEKGAAVVRPNRPATQDLPRAA